MLRLHLFEDVLINWEDYNSERELYCAYFYLHNFDVFIFHLWISL